jgi:uncharacterized membrane protein (UPF0182 family)
MFRLINAWARPKQRPTSPNMPPRRPRVSTFRRPTISPANRRRLILIVVLAVLAIALFASSRVWLQWWWFNSMGYGNVMVRRALLKIAAFILVFAIGAGIVGGSASVAFRKTRQNGRRNVIVRAIDRLLVWLVIAATIVTGGGLAWWTASKWQVFALWWNGRSLGVKDPEFHRDASFYLFALPALELIWRVAGIAVLVSLAVTAVIYLIRLGLNLRRLGALPVAALRHLLVLVGICLLLGAVWFWLGNYRLVYSTRGAAYGVSYTDAHAIRIGNWVAAIALLIAAAACIAGRKVPARREAFLAGIVIVFLTVLVNGLLPLFVKEAIVNPDELNKERQYLANNLAMTSYAYGLDTVQTSDLSGAGDPTLADVNANPDLLSNVRLWDYRVARTTYQEVTSYAGYYHYLDVDVDRYPAADGTQQQVLISAREMDQAGLPQNAQTWTNRRLVYTHGYGAVVSPVDQANRSGLPVFEVSEIPPDGSGAFTITYPEIYYGEANLDWVIVGSKVPEFTALPDIDAQTSLTQDDIVGGIRLDDSVTKLISAVSLKDRNIFISGNVTSSSTLLLHRQIRDRIHQIAPFLTLDDDPYLVMADGRLVWIVDAYTTSDRFPMSTPQDGINYMRASVKVTVDARTGETIFYRTAETDPIADAYGRMFPTLFTPIANAPLSISAHFRYPEGLYNVQSRVFGSIHVNDPDQFYNGEDKWSIPGSLVSEGLLEDQSDRDEMPGYYLNLPLPGEAGADFTLVRPFVPGGNSQRKNMTAWMAGRSDPQGNLSLAVYRFPRQTNVFGPAQVEARIDQEPAIVQQLALWNQSGSEVLQGNLMIIPVNQTVIYIQPIYLRSTGGSSIPELRRVIVATSDTVFMGDDLQTALTGALTGEAIPEPPDTGGATGNAGTDVATLVQQANDAYNRGQDALAKSDWAAYGQAQADLATALANLQELTRSPTPVPGGTPQSAPTP